MRAARCRSFLIATVLAVAAGLSRPAEGTGTALAVEVLPSAIVQGQAVRVRVRTAAPASAIMLRVDGRAVPLHRSAGGYQAFVGTSPLTKPGALRVKAAISGQAGVATAQARVVVRAGTFGIRRLTVLPRCWIRHWSNRNGDASPPRRPGRFPLHCGAVPSAVRWRGR